MNNFIKLGIASLILTSSNSFSAIPAEGWYFGLFGEGSLPPSINFTANVPANLLNGIPSINYFRILNGLPILTNPVNGEIKYSFGGGAGGQIGYRYCGFRFEGELLFNYNTYKNITIGGLQFGKSQQVVNGITIFPFSMSGHTALGALFFNAFYDFYNTQSNDVSWMPYIGLGIGIGHLSNSFVINYNYLNQATGLNAFTSLLSFSSSTSTPLAQGILGISYLLDDTFTVGMDFRHIESRQISSLNGRFALNTINFNFNYWFDTL